MKSDSPSHQRHSIRVPGYDYSQPGAYFVTICTHDRQCLLDEPILRQMIEDAWRSLPARYPGIRLDEFIIMPNHIHCILWLNMGAPLVGATLAVDPDAVAQDRAGVGATLAVDPDAVDQDRAGVGATLAVDPDAVDQDRAGASPAPTLGQVVGTFKSLVFKVYRRWVESNDPSRRAKIWQRNYYEHIIRNDRELEAIRQYIIENPANWEDDEENIGHTPDEQPSF